MHVFSLYHIKIIFEVAYTRISFVEDTTLIT